MKLSGRVTISSLTFYVALFCIMTYSFCEHTTISIQAFGALKRPLLLLAGLCLFAQLKVLLKCIRKKENVTVLVLIVVFILTIVYQAISHVNLTASDIVINFSVYLLELFLLMMCAAATGREKQVFNVMFWWAFCIVIIVDLGIFTGWGVFPMGSLKSYLIGTKFSVSYAHIYLLAFFLSKTRNRSVVNQINVLLLIVYITIVFFITSKVDCNTGLIGCIIFVALVLILNASPSNALKKFGAPVLFTIILIGSALFAFASEQILSLPSVANFVVNVLHRDVTMTGRTEIYGVYLDVMKEHWLWGYGYIRSVNIFKPLFFGCANAQNALLQWITQIGILSTGILVTLFITIFKQLSKNKDLKTIMPMIALIYTFVLLGTVEITINMNFFLWMALIFMWSRQKSEEKIR